MFACEFCNSSLLPMLNLNTDFGCFFSHYVDFSRKHKIHIYRKKTRCRSLSVSFWCVSLLHHCDNNKHRTKTQQNKTPQDKLAFDISLLRQCFTSSSRLTQCTLHFAVIFSQHLSCDVVKKFSATIITIART